MASKLKITKPVTHHRYRCKTCGKVDRRGRLVGHILKTHISLDQVPYSCSLCNFRCTDKRDLHSHVTNYARHREEMARTGITDPALVLNQSANPAKLDEYMVDLDSAFGSPAVAIVHDGTLDGGDDLALPDWLADAANENIPAVTRVMSIPSPKRTPLQSIVTNMTAFPTLDLSALTPEMTTGFFAGSMSNNTTSSVLNTPVWQKTPVTVETNTHKTTPLQAAQRPTVLPTAESQPPLISYTPVNPPATTQPMAPVSTTTKSCTAAPPRYDTPVQDEVYDILPSLIHVDGADTLLNERDEPPAKRPRSVQKTPGVSLDKDSILAIVNAINRGNDMMVDAMKQNTRRVEALDRTMRCVLDEIHSVSNGIQAIVRNTRQQNTQPQSTVRVITPKKNNKKKYDRR